MKPEEYTMRGSRLCNIHHQRIAYIRGEEIYDNNNQRIATMRGDNLYDSDGRIMMMICDDYIYDAKNIRVGSLSDAKKSIKGKGEGNLTVALWYCFIR
jgi:hypothetical protein